ncbi:MAG: hypothetical protein IJ228_08620 [Succinivibrio sp.]|nr:hypothetical protein [Succinivibrio sp.]
MTAKTEELLKLDPFYYEDKVSWPNSPEGSQSTAPRELFYQAVVEELVFHYEHNELYREFCKRKGFDPRGFSGSLSAIPPVHASVFKELGAELNSVPLSDIRLTLQSSATSGVPSSAPIDKVTSRRQALSMVKTVGSIIGNERRPFFIMDVDPREGFRKQLGARYAAVSGYLNFASEAFYFLKATGPDTFSFDIPALSAAVDALKGESAVIFGFTYILYAQVLKPLFEQGIQLKLPEGSQLIHIGGWKKLEREKVSKERFNELAAQTLGLSPAKVVDIYGFTEQMGLNYPDCPCGCKHTPLYSEVLIRDITTNQILPPGEIGLLEFVTPIPHSYPGNAVLTDDLGVIVPGPCPYHRAGTSFKISGRLKNAEIRGCGDILSTKLKFTAPAMAAGKIAPNHAALIRYNYDGSTQQSTLPVAAAIAELKTELTSKLAYLRALPVDALIGFISQVAQKWLHNRESLPTAQAQGLNFLVNWCSVDNLNAIANAGLRGNRHHVDAFLPLDDYGSRALKATSRGLICHWLAGNVLVLGMFVLIQSILCKNVNLIRVSSRDHGALAALLSAFNGETFTTSGGQVLKGEDLLSTIALIYYPHDDGEAGSAMSRAAAARIAWGGAEAVTAVTSFPSPYDCPDIIMGPKLSLSVVSREALTDERAARKLSRKCAVDASVFDQTGCASTHNIFVERGGGISPEDFAQLLAHSMAKVAVQMPKGEMSREEYAAVHAARGIYDFKGRVFGAEDSVWTVLYDDRPYLNPPLYSRVVFVHAVDSIDEVLDFITPDIQSVGLAAAGDKAQRFAAAAAERGAVRFPACGRMLNFESPWDGMFIMERLVRWVTLGGPNA